MSNQRHIIGRTVLELNTGRLADVWSLQEDASQVFYQRLVPELERLFDRLVEPNEVVRLDQVMVNVGAISPQDLPEELTRQVVTELDRILSDRLSTLKLQRQLTETSSTSEDAEISLQDRATADWEVLLYFLRYGRLPWWCPTEAWQAWLPRWEVALQQRTDWRQPLQTLLTTNPLARQRFVMQLPAGFRQQCLLQLQPAWIGWTALLVQAQRLMQALNLSRRAMRSLETQAWLLLLAEIRSDSPVARPLPAATWVRNWLTALVQTWLSEGAIASELTNRPTPPTEQVPLDADDGQILFYQRVEQQLRSVLETFSEAEQTLWLEAIPDAVAACSLPEINCQIPFQQSRSSTQAGEAGVDQSLPLTEPIIDESAQPLRQPDPSTSSGDASGVDEMARNEAIASPPQRSGRSPLSTEEETAGLYIHQAGLVLLHPFLQIYLEEVGLLAGEAFRDEAAQQMAVYLLHYLATGQTTAPEPELVLPKLLCGWPLNDPVEGELELPAAALAEGEHLLRTVIGYWEVLKNTSPDGLREGFLQREGKLTHTDSGWKLLVERQSIDVLLGRLPWGVSMVALPWMDGLLTVEWT